MTISSQPADYSTTLSDSMDTITISGIDTIDLNSAITTTSIIDYASSAYSYTGGAVGSTASYSVITGGGGNGGAGTYTISGLSNAQINTISNISINIDDFKIAMPEEWVNCLPDFDRIEKMCEEYPGLKIAYEKFKTTYKLVADHYDTPKDKRPKP